MEVEKAYAQFRGSQYTKGHIHPICRIRVHYNTIISNIKTTNFYIFFDLNRIFSLFLYLSLLFVESLYF